MIENGFHRAFSFLGAVSPAVTPLRQVSRQHLLLLLPQHGAHLRVLGGFSLPVLASIPHIAPLLTFVQYQVYISFYVKQG